MRTSNKILSGTFIATVLVITGIHAVLFAKIKSGNITTFREANEARTRILLGNVKHVSISGFEEFVIAPADSTYFEVGDNRAKDLKYRIDGDSLIVDAGGREEDYKNGSRRYLPVTLFLPPVESITAKYSHVFLRGGKDSAAAISRSIAIDNTELDVQALTRELQPAYWKSLQVNASGSRAVFTAGAVISDLSVSLNSNSLLTDAGADLQQLSLQVDSTSSVNLRKNSLNNIKIIK